MRTGIATILLTCVLSASSFAETSTYVGFRHRARIAAPSVMLVPQAQPQYIYVQPAQPAPIYVQPAPSAIRVPAAVTVQTVVPQTTLRWGFFRKRQIPTTTYQLGPMLNYQLQTEGQ